MSFLEISFFIFVAVLFLLYYVLPKKCQWILLLAGSLVFYALTSWTALPVLALETLVIFFLTKSMEGKGEKSKKMLVAISVLAGIVLLLLLKYAPASGFFQSSGDGFLGKGLLFPLGISYYTLMIMGYAIDVYREQIPAEKNFARLMLFAFYFPSITQGPLNRYGHLSVQFKEEHGFDSKKIFKGLLRFGWGAFKKMVIANRAAVFISAVYVSTKSTGIIILLAFLLTMFQLYADFSGCVDMALGVSTLFGIELPENFRQPYFSRSLEEFWRRWHITLGAWLKEYLYYPMTMSSVAKKFIKAGDKASRKKRALLVSNVSLFILWIVMGIWHGAGLKFWIIGLYFAVLFLITVSLGPAAKTFAQKHPKTVESPVYKLWQQLRTFLFIWFATVLISVTDLKQFASLMGTVFNRFKAASLFSATMGKFDFSWLQWILLLIGLVTMLIVSIIEYRTKEKICDLVMRQNFTVRILIYWFVLILILLSLNISNTEFIYAQF